MKILLLAVSLSCLGACRMPMNKKPDWTRALEPREDARAFAAADIPAEIESWHAQQENVAETLQAGAGAHAMVP